MRIQDYSDIWKDTLGQTLDIIESDASMTNGLSENTSQRYQEASQLSDEEIWAKIQAGEL